MKLYANGVQWGLDSWSFTVRVYVSDPRNVDALDLMGRYAFLWSR